MTVSNRELPSLLSLLSRPSLAGMVVASGVAIAAPTSAPALPPPEGELAWSPPSERSAEPTSPDWSLAAAVIEALTRDSELSAWTIGVDVRDHTASLWGCLPTCELARRAEEIVLRVDGIAAVRNECRIDTAAAEPAAATTPPQAAAAADAEPASTAEAPQWHAPSANAPPPRKQLRATTTTSSVETALKPSVQLLAPLPLRQEPEVARSFEQLRASDSRYAGLNVRLSGGAVQLEGTASSWEAVLQLATSLTQVPGVERVSISGVRVAPRRP